MCASQEEQTEAYPGQKGCQEGSPCLIPKHSGLQMQVTEVWL